MWGVGSVGGAELASEVLWVRLLVWKAGPSFREAVSMLIDIPVGETSLEKQSTALFLAPEIHSNVIIVCCNFQTPSVYFVIGVLAIKELH